MKSRYYVQAVRYYTIEIEATSKTEALKLAEQGEGEIRGDEPDYEYTGKVWKVEEAPPKGPRIKVVRAKGDSGD